MAERQAHVKRIHKTVRDADDIEYAVDDTWVDVLRIDKMSVAFAATEDNIRGQIINDVFRWNDDPFNQDPNIDNSNSDIQWENGNANRKTKQVLIRDPWVHAPPEKSPAAPPDTQAPGEIPIMPDDNAINLWAVERLRIEMPKQPKEGSPLGQFVKFVFNNNPLDGSKGTPAKRTTSVIKIVNNDLNGLQMNAPIPDEGDAGAPSAGTPFVIDWPTYRQALLDGHSNPNDPFFLPVEFTDDFTVVFGASADKGQMHQNIKYVLTNNRAIENMFEAADPKTLNVDNQSALIRTDPLQVVINVGSNIIAVQFPAGPP